MAAKLELRPHQKALVDGIHQAWAEGDTSVCLWGVTGLGKTELSVELARQEAEGGGHTLFLINRITLATQTANRFLKYGLLPGILRAEDTLIRGYEPVTIASVATTRSEKRSETVDAILTKTTLVVIDETHVWDEHYDALLGCLPDVRLVGLTATPLREGLGLRYQRLVKGPSYTWMIDNGYLVRPRYFMPSTAEVSEGLAGVSVASTGDFKERQLSALMRRKTILGDVVGTYKAKGEDRPAIVFAVDIAHSKALVDEFRTAGISAEHIDYRTDNEERQKAFERFRRGETKVLCSVAVLGIGFDEPCASCVILARPTLSLALHIQQVGRGLRMFDGKSDCLVFDHAGNIRRHGRIEDFEPPELSDIDKRSDKKRRNEYAADFKPCPECSAILEPKQRICHECCHENGRKNRVDFVPAELTEAGQEVAPGVSMDELKRIYRMNLWITRARGKGPEPAFYRTIEYFGISKEEAKKRRLIPWSWRNLESLPPDDAYLRWEQSRRIAYAKSKGRTHQHRPRVREGGLHAYRFGGN
jgi:DNA repair protein RadD